MKHSIKRFSSSPRFIADKHLPLWNEFKANGYTLPNIKRYTLSELGLNSNIKSTNFNNTNNHRNYFNLDFAFHEPIRFLSEEAIDIIHSELSKDKILQNCYYQRINNPQQIAIRGTHQYSPFMKEFMNSPQITHLLSYITQIELDLYSSLFERGTIILQKATNNNKDNKLTWHYDSQPFTLLIMISDPCTIMQNEREHDAGGTLYEDGNGIIHEIIYPKAGYGAIVQAAKIHHTANYSKQYLRAMCATSYKKKNTMDWGNLNIASQYTSFEPLLADHIQAKFSDLKFQMDCITNECIEVGDEDNWNTMKENVVYDNLLCEMDDIKKQMETLYDSVEILQKQEMNDKIPQRLLLKEPLLRRG